MTRFAPGGDPLDYASITRAVEWSAAPSSLCQICGHAEGWHTWHQRVNAEAVVLVGQCLHRAEAHAPLCACLREQALTP